MSRLLLTCSIALVLTLTLPAADWHQFRGPTGQGHAESKNLPTEWDKAKNVTWRKELPGLGWSSPVIVGGKVYLTTAVGDGGSTSLRALCVDAASGNLDWNVEVFQPDAKLRRKAGMNVRVGGHLPPPGDQPAAERLVMEAYQRQITAAA